MIQLRKRLGFGLLASLSLLTLVMSIFPIRVHADGETYKWKDYNTIVVSGGDFKQSTEFKLAQGSNPQRFTAFQYPEIKAGCRLEVILQLVNDTTVTLDVATKEDHGGTEARPQGQTWCSDQKKDCTFLGIGCKYVDAFPGVPEHYNGRTVTVGGTRPGSSNQSESDLDREVVVVINSPNTNTNSPSTIGIQIKDASNKVVASATPSKEAALGNTDPNSDLYVDPNFQPVYYLGDFHLDPGKYVVCADIVIPDCRSFEKVKFKSLHLEYGDNSTQRTLKVKVHVTYIGGVQNMTVGPFDVNVKKPSGETISQQTDKASHKMSKDEEQVQGGVTATYEFYPETTFNGLDPGTYEVCVDGVDECKKVEKKVGEAAEVTIEVDWNAFSADDTTEKDCKDKYQVLGVKGITYLVCSFIDTGTYAVGALDSAIAGLLTVDTKDIFADANQDNAYHIAWNSFRAFALGLIVIIAIVMVVAQAIGSDIVNAYTIRKVLPRLLFAAIFITLSWDIMEFLTNLSNDAGNGIRGLIYAPFRDLPHGGDIGGGTLFVLTMLGTGGALALGWIGLLSFVATGLLASLVAVTVLVLRKMLIILLIMIAPFAIAAGVLPNTRKIYDKWKGALIAVLVVFPIIMSFIAIGRIFSTISFNAAATMDGSGGQTVTQIIAFIAYFGPYFMISFAFKMAGGVIATLGGIVNDRSKGAFDRLRNFRGNKINENMGKMARGERFQGSNPLARGFNAATFGAVSAANAKSKGTFLNPGNYLTRSGRARLSATRHAVMEQQRSLNAMKYGESQTAKVVAHNDPVLRAQTYATAAEALRNMSADFGMDQARVVAAVNAAKANGGFTRDRQVYAVKQLFNTGTGYDNLRQAVESINRVAGSNADMAMSIIGEGNFISGIDPASGKGTGRFDLKIGFDKYAELYGKMQANGNLNDDDIDDAYVKAIMETDANTLLRGKPRAVQNVTPAIRKKLDQSRRTAADTSLSAQERDAAREESGRLAGIIEQLQSSANMYASPINTQTVDEAAYAPTAVNRDAVQQEASPVMLVRDPNTGDLRPQTIPAPTAANPNARTYVPNLGQDSDTARGYDQQRPRRPGQ